MYYRVTRVAKGNVCFQIESSFTKGAQILGNLVTNVGISLPNKEKSHYTGGCIVQKVIKSGLVHY